MANICPIPNYNSTIQLLAFAPTKFTHQGNMEPYKIYIEQLQQESQNKVNQIWEAHSCRQKMNLIDTILKNTEQKDGMP